jgi:hypothetical protein
MLALNVMSLLHMFINCSSGKSYVMNPLPGISWCYNGIFMVQDLL